MQEGGGQKEREGESESQEDFPLSMEPDMGSNSTTHEIMIHVMTTWAEIKSQMLNQLSHPGALLEIPFEITLKSEWHEVKK